MRSGDPAQGIIYHLALVKDWAEAQAAGEYRISTIGRSLEDEGFIHASFPEQVRETADSFYLGRDVVLLTLDMTAIPAEVRVEKIPDGRHFPHIYGPIPLSAVLDASPIPIREDGTLDLPDLG
jgi:glutathione S-transferase